MQRDTKRSRKVHKRTTEAQAEQSSPRQLPLDGFKHNPPTTNLSTRSKELHLLAFEDLYSDRDPQETARLVELFDLGRIVLTARATQVLFDAGVEPVVILWRHATGDWGEIHSEDRALNDEAAATGNSAIYSVYRVAREQSVWVVTDAARSATMVMLPEEWD